MDVKFAFFVLICLVIGVESQVPPNPWIDTSMCLPTDTPVECSMKKKQCSPINNLLKPPAGGSLVGSITSCSNATGITLGLSYYLNIGLAFSQNKPESLMDNISTDPKVSSALRLCVLNSTGLIGTDGKFNRTSAIVALAGEPLGPNLIVPVFSALLNCPEPADNVIGPFLSCLREACMANATATYPGGLGGKILPKAPSPKFGQSGSFAGSFGPTVGEVPKAPMSPEIAKLVASFY